ncbi:MAG: hypothetical protein WB815_02470, partial [Nitrososphaeraceae archaeon]
MNQQPLLLVVYAVLIISLFNTDNFFKSRVYGHDFIPDESASFLAFANQLKTESELVQSNLANGNVDLAKEHAIRAIELLNSTDPINNVTWKDEIAERNQRVANELVRAVSNLENITMSSPPSEQQQQSIPNDTTQLTDEIDAIIEDAITSRIESDQRGNATIQATALGDIINNILRNYGNAYAVGFDMANMSEMASMMGVNSSNKNSTLVNIVDYQSAQALATKAIEIFNNELRSSNGNVTNPIAKLEDGLTQLNNSIKNKASPMDVMIIGHTQVHPNLQAAFNLQMKM